MHWNRTCARNEKQFSVGLETLLSSLLLLCYSSSRQIISTFFFLVLISALHWILSQQGTQVFGQQTQRWWKWNMTLAVCDVEWKTRQCCDSIRFRIPSLNGAGRPTLHTSVFVLNWVEGHQGFSAVITGCLQLSHITIIKKQRKTIDADAIWL